MSGKLWLIVDIGCTPCQTTGERRAPRIAILFAAAAIAPNRDGSDGQAGPSRRGLVAEWPP